MPWLLYIIAAVLVGLGAGYVLREVVLKKTRHKTLRAAKETLAKAKAEAEEVIEKAKSRREKIIEEARTEERKAKRLLTDLEQRILKKEERLERQEQELDEKKTALRERIRQVKDLGSELEKRRGEIEKKLAEVAKLTKKQAREEMYKTIEKEVEEDLIHRLKKLEATAQEKLDEKASEILTQTIQRIATNHIEEHTTSTVQIPSEEVKGKIIGKEGRNIRTFQQVTGVELIIDDTPEAVVISSFSPLRRQVAKTALERLIKDGRIQPARIEEIVEKVKSEFSEKIRELGEGAVYELGITDFHPKLVNLIGMLYFRTSYGQNILRHSLEAAHIGALLANEIGADAGMVKRACLLHDIGKAMSHESEGSHVEIGKRIMEKFKVDPKIIEAAIAHHEDYPFSSLESRIVQTADAISASRPGARRESYEQYIKRLEELEAIATSFKDVKKAYAIQAGREIRIFIDPEAMTDLEARKLARSIAQKIEKDLVYPGEIKVSVIREMRVVEYAR